jgi:uncharacterized protein YtpQ (UPF0354 family)
MLDTWLKPLAVLTLILALAAPSTAQTKAPADPVLTSVRTELLARLKSAPSIATTTVVNPTTLSAEAPDKTQLTISLDNLTAEVRAKPDQRQMLIDRFARMIELTLNKGTAAGQPEPTKAQFLATLRPVIRHKDYLQSATGSADKAADFEILWRPLAGDAVVLIAIDSSEHIQMVTRDRAKLHAVTDDAIFQTALDNLKALAASVEIGAANQFRIVAVSEDYYSGSMILLPDVMARLEKELGRDFLVIIPDRNTLIASAAKDAAALNGLNAHLARQRKAPALLPQPLQRTGTSWKAVQ